jgi:hypothetical protein
MFFFGSLWGLSEVVVGKQLFDANIPYASAGISAWAFFILAFARGVMNKPGTSTAIAGIAAVFRLVNATYVCHIFGIFLLGVAFDLAFSLLAKHRKTIYIQRSLAGVVGAYGGHRSLYYPKSLLGLRWIAENIRTCLCKRELCGTSFSSARSPRILDRA